jgi:hypothetical protein
MSRVRQFVPLALLASSTLFAGCNDDEDVQAPADGSVADAGHSAVDAGIDGGGIDSGLPAGDAAAPTQVDASADAAGPVPGVTSSAASYLVPVASGVMTKAILTVGDAVGTKPNGSPYRLVGIPDGLGAYDNGDGTFTVLANHELQSSVGIARAHGGIGAFVSSWVIRKADLHVLAGKDLIQQVNLWDPSSSSYKAGTNVAFGRFCSADLAATTAWFNAGTGFDGRLFLNGEETGDEGRALAHGLDGISYELPRLGKASWENMVASPTPGAKTIVVGLDDTSPNGQVYVYVGTKTSTGTPVEKAGLTNGKLYGVAVTGAAIEDEANGIPPGAFTLAELGNVENKTGATLSTDGTALAVTAFRRPEDGAWDPARPTDFYFATTASFSTGSRLWRLRFSDITQPELGGTVEAVLDGSEGQKMLDNITIDARGHVIATEDVGNQAHIGRVYRYSIASDKLEVIAQHDPALFTMGAPGFITQDEESSGVLDASSLLGAGWFLIDVQAHAMNADPELVEFGQLIALFDPGSV